MRTLTLGHNKEELICTPEAVAKWKAGKNLEAGKNSAR